MQVYESMQQVLVRVLLVLYVILSPLLTSSPPLLLFPLLPPSIILTLPSLSLQRFPSLHLAALSAFFSSRGLLLFPAIVACLEAGGHRDGEQEVRAQVLDPAHFHVHRREAVDRPDP